MNIFELTKLFAIYMRSLRNNYDNQVEYYETEKGHAHRELKYFLDWLKNNQEQLDSLTALENELALALEVASIAQVWGNPSPFQDRINELLVRAGRKPINAEAVETHETTDLIGAVHETDLGDNLVRFEYVGQYRRARKLLNNYAAEVSNMMNKK